MYDVLLNAVKFAFSDDARKGVSAVVDLIQHSPEWQKDICTLEAKIEAIHPEHAALLAGITAAKLTNLQYCEEGIQSFRTSYTELASNAFQHGCGDNGYIHIRIEISAVYVSVTLTNAKGHEFSLSRSMERSRRALIADPNRSRGRGLLMTSQFADSLQQIGKRAVKVVFYQDRVKLNRTVFKGIVVYRLDSGALNPSLPRRITTAATNDLAVSDVILDLSNFAAAGLGSDVVTFGLRLSGIGRNTGRRFVVLVSPNVGIETTLFYTDELMVESWDDALAVLGTGISAKELISAIGTRPRRVLLSGAGWVDSRHNPVMFSERPK